MFWLKILFMLQTNVNIERVFTELTTKILAKDSYHMRAGQDQLTEQLLQQRDGGNGCSSGCFK